MASEEAERTEGCGGPPPVIMAQPRRPALERSAEEGEPVFFILGLKTRLSTVDSGMFRCPNEGGDRAYRHEKARRWFTLFFIPLIPLGTQGERVRCQSCGAQYGPDVAARHPAGRGA